MKAEWGTTAEGRRARYYELTPAGRRELRVETTQWLRYAETLTEILTAEAKPA